MICDRKDIKPDYDKISWFFTSRYGETLPKNVYRKSWTNYKKQMGRMKAELEAGFVDHPKAVVCGTRVPAQKRGD